MAYLLSFRKTVAETGYKLDFSVEEQSALEEVGGGDYFDSLFQVYNARVCQRR